MPRRNDIKKVMLIGSGAITIGQGCEFDYSGVQACKVLKKEQIEVVLVNSNPATIMTDPEYADRTYIEPLTFEVLREIIRRERPDALLPTLGGQTALNLAMELYEKGVLERYNVELIGAKAQAIKNAEDRQLFKEKMKEIGLSLPMSGSAHSLKEAKSIAKMIGKWPLVIRPGFTLGGSGGGIAYNEEEFVAIVTRGLSLSRNSEVLIEESLLGWKEYELEVIRDYKDNCIVVCSIENIDPMGVHTGDSITVAPAQTLSDKQYQLMRDNSFKVMRVVGVETGGSNVQWAVNPQDGRQVVIEMNPRVSRSSALASKATGFPIAKVATMLAIGYSLDEITNDITGNTSACFEPAIDYVVTKVPRFNFEKFPTADDTLGTQMKSVGEAMAIGRSFKQSFQKALRSLDINRYGFGADGKNFKFEKMDDNELKYNIKRPNSERVFAIYEAIKRGITLEEINQISSFDMYFLRHFKELVDFEKTINFTENSIKKAKIFGFSDKQLAHILNKSEKEVRKFRYENNIIASFNLIDSCAGEFEAKTPYYYSSYVEYNEPIEKKESGKKSIMILGGGPNRIGQGIEFDYCCVHACLALKEHGITTVMVNCNPETVSTDYDTSDKLYFEPLTAEDIIQIYERERCDGVIVQLGGQTPLNLAKDIEDAGLKIIGTSTKDIANAEDRDFFQKIVTKLNLNQPLGAIARSTEEALKIAERINYPVLVRPSFVLGGRGMAIVHKEENLKKLADEANIMTDGKSLLIESFLENAIEIDVDAISDGEETIIGAIMEHVEPAGIHSGDSACCIPTRSLGKEMLEKIRTQTKLLAKELNVCGLVNIQFAIKDDTLYIIEVNPRASRTTPLVSKAIGVQLAKKAALCMVGKSLSELNFTEEVSIPYTVFKEAVFPFIKFSRVEMLSPEMKSTGEVMGIDYNVGNAYLKAQMAADNAIPMSCSVFVSLKDADKINALPLIEELIKMGFSIYCTSGTGKMLYKNGIKCNAVFRISEGNPNILDLLDEKKIQWVVNTIEQGAEARQDEIRMRLASLVKAVPITTTLQAFEVAVTGLKNSEFYTRIEVCSLQEYHRQIKRLV